MREGLLFCSIFDAGFAGRWLAMHRSLALYVPDLRMCAVCLDEPSREIVDRLALPGVSVLTLQEVEAGDPELAAVKGMRTPRGYMSTARPSICLRLLAEEDPASLVYLDADILFFSDPDPFVRELDHGSVVLVPQWHSDDRRHLDETFGEYNAGTIAFRNDEHGVAALRTWREQCLEWCAHTPEPGRFGNQRYLNKWPEALEGVRVVSHPGVGFAPWNSGRFELAAGNGEVLVDGRPLVFYHYSGLSFAGGPEPLLRTMAAAPALRFRDGAVPFTWGHHWHRFDPVERELVWDPYARAVAEAFRELGTADARRGLEPAWRQFREVVLRRRVLYGAMMALRRLLWHVGARAALERVESLRKRWRIE